MPEKDPTLLVQIAANPLPWIAGVLASANAVQYGRDWLRERRYQREMQRCAEALAASELAHRQTMATMLPTLALVLDEMKKS